MGKEEGESSGRWGHGGKLVREISTREGQDFRHKYGPSETIGVWGGIAKEGK